MRDYRLYLKDILAAIESIEDFVNRKTCLQPKHKSGKSCKRKRPDTHPFADMFCDFE